MKKAIFIILLTACFSCKKNDNAYIKGTVTKVGSGLPFPNVTIYLEENTSGFMGASYEIIDSTTTDATGNYMLRYHKSKRNIYGKHKYFVSCNPKDIHGIESYKIKTRTGVGTKSQTLNFSINPFAYMKFHLNKTSSSSNWVAIRFDVRSAANEMKLVTHPFPFDTILPAIPIPGDENLDTFEWGIYNESSPPHVSIFSQPDNIIIKAGDTLVYPISYY